MIIFRLKFKTLELSAREMEVILFFILDILFVLLSYILYLQDLVDCLDGFMKYQELGRKQIRPGIEFNQRGGGEQLNEILNIKNLIFIKFSLHAVISSQTIRCISL